MHEKRHFLSYRKRRHDAQMTDHISYTTSLWGVAAKWPTRAPKMKLIPCLPERPTRIQPYQFEPVRQDFERVPEHRVSFDMRYSMGFAKSHSLKCSLHNLMGVMRPRSMKVSSFELYKLNPLSPRVTAGRLRGSSCIAIPGVVSVRIVTVRGHSRPAQ